MFSIRIMFHGVPTGTIINFDDAETCETMYDRFQQLKSERDVFYGPKYTIDFTQVRMIEIL